MVDSSQASAATPSIAGRPARLAGTWNVYEGDFDLFRGVGGEGREMFRWCRRTEGRARPRGWRIRRFDRRILRAVGLMEEDDDVDRRAPPASWAGPRSRGDPLGRFELRRKMLKIYCLYGVAPRPSRARAPLRAQTESDTKPPRRSSGRPRGGAARDVR